MSLQNYSGGPNPFIEASKLLGRLRKKPEQAHSEILQKHLEVTNQAHEHAVGLINAHYSAASNYMKDVNRSAEPGTSISVVAPGHSATYTKKTPKTKATTAPAKTAKPLPVRDPKTGRAMKAPQ